MSCVFATNFSVINLVATFAFPSALKASVSVELFVSPHQTFLPLVGFVGVSPVKTAKRIAGINTFPVSLVEVNIVVSVSNVTFIIDVLVVAR